MSICYIINQAIAALVLITGTNVFVFLQFLTIMIIEFLHSHFLEKLLNEVFIEFLPELN